MSTICVYCAASRQVPQRYVELAAAVGTEIARRGHSLVSGGGSISCMGAVARAARAGGAHTSGVIPKVMVEAELADLDVEELIVTATMRERKAEMEARADSFLALPGGLGTLEELLEIWVARTLGLHAKPVVVLDPDGVFELLRQQMAELCAAGFMRNVALNAATFTTTLGQAFEALEAPASSMPSLDLAEMLEADP